MKIAALATVAATAITAIVASTTKANPSAAEAADFNAFVVDLYTSQLASTPSPQHADGGSRRLRGTGRQLWSWNQNGDSSPTLNTNYLNFLKFLENFHAWNDVNSADQDFLGDGTVTGDPWKRRRLQGWQNSGSYLSILQAWQKIFNQLSSMNSNNAGFNSVNRDFHSDSDVDLGQENNSAGDGQTSGDGGKRR